jgi:hypothetical protein
LICSSSRLCRRNSWMAARIVAQAKAPSLSPNTSKQLVSPFSRSQAGVFPVLIEEQLRSLKSIQIGNHRLIALTCQLAQQRLSVATFHYQDPVLFILTQGSFGGSACPFWSSSIDTPSGDLTKAI